MEAYGRRFLKGEKTVHPKYPTCTRIDCKTLVGSEAKKTKIQIFMHRRKNENWFGFKLIKTNF